MLTILLAVTDASCLMHYFTRFTDEIFAALISVIFIYKAIESLVHIFHDLDVKQHHDIALLSLLLVLGTFYIAITLQGLRRSRSTVLQIRAPDQGSRSGLQIRAPDQVRNRRICAAVTTRLRLE